MILMLAQRGDSTVIVYNALKKAFGDVQILIENAVPPAQLLLRRIKNLGFIPVLGQVLFRACVVPNLRWKSRKRINQILQDNDLDLTSIPRFIEVRSVNTDAARQIIKSLNPDVVVVNGTRIFSRETLAVIRCPAINMHAGITPLYRGVHGAYWALTQKKPELCGVTVHYLDAGIDTGEVISQALIAPLPADNFTTFPYLQIAKGLPLLVRAIREIIAGNRPRSQPLISQSKLWHYPTIWQYWRNKV